MTAHEKTQAQELADAAQEHRQPVCVYCDKPLDVVTQTQYEYISWVWDKEEGMFIKSSDTGDADIPIHEGCGTPDWDFVESGEATRTLGLTF